MHLLFRVIKACADFPNVSYILAFDEAMVAEAIGERYGGEGEAAGLKFLEKIVQVPLKLPAPATEDLRKLSLGGCLREGANSYVTVTRFAWQARQITRTLRSGAVGEGGIDASLLQHVSPIEWDNVIL